MAECVKVMVRCRPMNKLEKSKNCLCIVDVDTKTNSITINSKEADGTKTFTYDCVFTIDSQQQYVYENTAFPLVESVVEGYNGTIFAYGQTGCGKTHSMVGIPTDEVHKGIIPRTFQHIINIVESANDKKFLVRCSYIEIYNEEIHDLLAKDCKAKLDLKESPDKGVFIKDVTMNVVKSVAEMDKWMAIGTDNRSVGATAMNKDSSRSHSLFTLFIECQIKSEIEGQEDQITAGKLNLVDLAGSERQSKTQATGDRLKEATKINLSLSALGNVISALVDGKTQHVPYRDSKLTRLLQDSLGGNTKTIMIAAVSPADYNYDETLSTLRYASRAKNIKNQPKVNQDPKDAMLKQYQEEIKKLKELLLRQQNGEQISFDMLQIQAAPQPQQNDNQNSNIQQQQQQDNKNNQQPQVVYQKVENTEELKKLKDQQQNLNLQNKKIQEQLKEKDQLYQQQLEEKQQMEQLIRDLQGKMMQGGSADEEKKQKLKIMRSKIKQQNQEKEKIQKEKEEKEEQYLFLEHKYSNLQEELEETQKIVRKLRQKYKQSVQEIKDLQKEHEYQKEEILDTVRYQQNELKIYQAICNMLLNPEEIEIIKSSGEWSDDYTQFKLPYFSLKPNSKNVKFTKLPQFQAQEAIQNEKQNRELIFEQPQQRTNNFLTVQGVSDFDKKSKGSRNASNCGSRVDMQEEFVSTKKTLVGMWKEEDDNNYNSQNNKNNGNKAQSEVDSFNNLDTTQANSNSNNQTTVNTNFFKKENHSNYNTPPQTDKIAQNQEKQKIPKVQLHPLSQSDHFKSSAQMQELNNTTSQFKVPKNMQLEPLQQKGLLQNNSTNNLLVNDGGDINKMVGKSPNRMRLDKIDYQNK